jgi:dihydroorotase
MRHLFRAFICGLVCTFAISTARSQQVPKYDLLLKGGHVIDPANGMDAKMDVAVSLGRIAAVQKDIPANDAGKVVDVTGLYVTPGLIDIHYHVGHGGAPLNWFAPDSPDHEVLPPNAFTLADPHSVLVPYGVPADLALQSGVTTIVDAGSAGADTFLQEKEEVIEHAKVRVLAFLNIVSDGMKGGLEQTVDQMDVKKCADTVLRYSDIIVGVKTAHYWPQRPLDDLHPTWAAVERAVACGEAAKVPVMYDFWPRPERSYSELILQKARPGDIHTHVFAQQFPIIVDGKLNPIIQQARDRGVIFDVGHGAGSFWFRNAVPAVKQGFVPDSMSTDLHIGDFTILSMSNVMSKFLSIGVPLADLIRRSTVNPAHEIHRPELGTLTVGREADIAVLEEQHGHYGFVDCGWAKMEGTSRIVAQMTIRAGRILYDPSGLSMVQWEKARPQYFNIPMLQGSPPATADSYPRN